MGNGIVLLVVVALWGVVLVPMFLRRHDAAVESKSVDRFSTAMRTLSRRNSSSGPREVLMPARAPRTEVTGGRAPAAASRQARAGDRQRMRRRRSIALALVGFLLVMAAAAVVGVVPLWLPAVVFVATAGYVANLRIQAVRAAEEARRQRRRAAREAGRAGAPAPRVERAPMWPVAEVASRRPIRTATVRTLDETAVVERERFAETAAVDAGSGWSAIDVILPTYVTAPPATAVPRVIDLTSPGSWSAAHMLEHAAAAGQPDPDEIFDRLAEVDAPATASYVAEHEAVAETVPGSTSRPFLEEDAVFDQFGEDDEEDELLALLDRRAVND